MAKHIQAVRGMNDILPADTASWQWLEDCARRVLDAYAYQEIRLPIVEKTELFKRTIGEVTDIVEKEMYTFEDRNGDSLSMRPEGTAGCVRAGIENGLLHNRIQRLWYKGPMFRHERPQKGRYRQFHQIGVECFGMAGPDVDAELIMMTARLWRELGISGLQLQLNTLGSRESRSAYRDTLVAYLSDHYERLDEDSRRRLQTNPLRVLDSKNPRMQDLIAAAPSLLDHLDAAAAAHFAGLRALLDAAGIDYQVNPRLVRGLDYYNYTVFEWVTDRLGAQGTVCAGGRFDGLVEQLGGRSTPALGFALGIERLVALLEVSAPRPAFTPHAYLILAGERSTEQGLLLAEFLRDRLPALRLQVNCGGGGFKSQFRRADNSGAILALILGDDEIARDTVSVKFLRKEQDQLTLERDALEALLAKLIAGDDAAVAADRV